MPENITSSDWVIIVAIIAISLVILIVLTPKEKRPEVLNNLISNIKHWIPTLTQATSTHENKHREEQEENPQIQDENTEKQGENVQKHIFILLSTQSEENLKLQLSGFAKAYSNIGNTGNYNIEFFILEQGDMERFIDEKIQRDTQDEYIIISTMSHLFSSLTSNLSNRFGNKLPRNIQVLGTIAASTSQRDYYQANSNIIRIFPPDYDESSKALDFLLFKFARNIQVYNNSEYGGSIYVALETEKRKRARFDVTFRPNIDHIHFIDSCFNANIPEVDKSCDAIFIVGYEPNISKLLSTIAENIDKKTLLLFSSAISVDVWERNIITILEEHKLLENAYIIEPSYNQDENILLLENLPDTFPKDIIKFHNKTFYQIGNLYDNKNQTNYISFYCYITLKIAANTFNNKAPLIEHLSIDEHFRTLNTDLLFNGDSISHFHVKKLNA